MVTYKYMGSGIMTFYVNGKGHTVSFEKPFVELEKRVKIAGLEEQVSHEGLDQPEKPKTIKKTKVK